MLDEATQEVQQTPKIESQKDLKERISARIMEELDAQFGDSIKQGLPVKKMYEFHTEMGFIERQFKAANPVVLDNNGTDIQVDFSINDGIRPEEIVSVLKGKVTDWDVFIESEAKDTHMEEFYKDAEERAKVIEDGMKGAVGHFKKAWKHWMVMLSSFFENTHNLIVEGSEVNKELRINGIFNVDANHGKGVQFYVNPQFVADSITKDGKSLETFSKKAEAMCESIDAIDDPVQKAELANLLKPLINRMPAALSSVKDLIKTCKVIKATKVPELQEASSVDGITEEPTTEETPKEVEEI